MGATSQLNNIGIRSFRLKLFCIVFQMLKPYNYCGKCTSNAWNFDMLKALIYTDVDICKGVKTDHRRRKHHTPKAIKLSGETAVRPTCPVFWTRNVHILQQVTFLSFVWEALAGANKLTAPPGGVQPSMPQLLLQQRWIFYI